MMQLCTYLHNTCFIHCLTLSCVRAQDKENCFSIALSSQIQHIKFPFLYNYCNHVILLAFYQVRNVQPIFLVCFSVKCSTEILDHFKVITNKHIYPKGPNGPYVSMSQSVCHRRYRYHLQPVYSLHQLIQRIETFTKNTVFYLKLS